ncbi:Transcription factor GTE1 [Forsythia ovata]|uniref:Transcription factor GTE1 n=1 Tax=Forsythia ovata TaxID=205694 RepID=A0ABD1V0K0_9LAMI
MGIITINPSNSTESGRFVVWTGWLTVAAYAGWRLLLFISLHLSTVSSPTNQMETVNGDALVVVPQETMGNVSDVESFNQQVDEIFIQVDQLEQNLNEVEQFYSSANKKQPNTPKGSSILKDKDRDKLFANFKRRQQDAASREAAADKRMQELMRQFGNMLRQITQHKWAGPFMQPVDVVGLGLHDYYEVIEKPMDFSTIKSKMEARDGNGYKNVREICADVRLIFKNAMKYNKERDDVHVMAKTLLEKFETKWLQLLPKVDEEEKRRKEEEAEMQLDMQLAQDAAHAKMARDLSIELGKVDRHLDELREMVLQNCRRMSTEEKRRLSSAIAKLSPEDIDKAVEIIAQSNPDFQAAREDVEINMDVQSESTLWKLKFFIKDALQGQGKSSPNVNEDNNQNNNNRRKREICDALAKTSQKRSKKFPG